MLTCIDQDDARLTFGETGGIFVILQCRIDHDFEDLNLVILKAIFEMQFFRLLFPKCFDCSTFISLNVIYHYFSIKKITFFVTCQV